MDIFLNSGVVISTVLMVIASIYFMFFDKSGKSFLYLMIILFVFAFFLLVSARNYDKLQNAKKCECIKESIDTNKLSNNLYNLKDE